MYACKMVYPSNACIKEMVNGYEISIAFDDSCNPQNTIMPRSDIRVYKISNNEDITDLICSDLFGIVTTIEGTIENLIKVYDWVNNHWTK